MTRCGTFDYRLSNSNDKGMDPWFLNSLRAQCNRDASRVVPLDDGSQFAFDTKYYANVIANRGVLESDAALNSPSTVARVRQLRDGTPQTFHGAFAAAMGRMGALRGANPGKVRDHCRRVRT